MGSKTVNGFVANDGIHKIVEDIMNEDLRDICYDSDTADAMFRVSPRKVTDAVLSWVVDSLTSDAAVEASYAEASMWDESLIRYKLAITAALEAACVTKGDNDDDM